MAIDVGDEYVQDAVAIIIAQVDAACGGRFPVREPVIVKIACLNTALGRHFTHQVSRSLRHLTLGKRTREKPFALGQGFLAGPDDAKLQIENDLAGPTRARFMVGVEARVRDRRLSGRLPPHAELAGAPPEAA